MLYLKDTQKWKQFTTWKYVKKTALMLCYISKILKNESNSQHQHKRHGGKLSCVISQRYSKMKAIHNDNMSLMDKIKVVLYLKDTQKWKQFTTKVSGGLITVQLCYISKILKNESNSQHNQSTPFVLVCCVISQRYSKMKAIHNFNCAVATELKVVLYLKDTQKWKQFTTLIDHTLSHL